MTIQKFSDPGNRSNIERLVNSLPQSPSGETTDFRPHLRIILRAMHADADFFDVHCSQNLKWIGPQFFSQLNELADNFEQAKNRLPTAFWMAFRFLCELEFSMPGELNHELRGVRQFVSTNIMSFDGENKAQLAFANFEMPVRVVKELISHPDIAVVRQFMEDRVSAEKLKREWDEDIANRQSHLEALRENIERLTVEYNFVGLVDGFKKMIDEKRRDKKFAFFSLIGLAALIIFPLAFESVFVFRNFNALVSKPLDVVVMGVPLLGLEIVLIYFFRVVLSHFGALKTQLLQLELRATLCQFIEGYATYAAQARKQDAGSLDRFESLIFSGLLMNDEKLPSTFDGAEQLAQLLAQFRGK